MKAKPWLNSRTNWFGGSLVALALAFLASSDLQTWVAALPGEYQGLALALIGLIIWYLRHITIQPVSSNKAAQLDIVGRE